MLVCPNCQFENPGSNKFCQQCGTSLIDRLCADCGTAVSLEQADCPQCGAQTGQIWRSISTPLQPQTPPTAPSAQLTITAASLTEIADLETIDLGTLKLDMLVAGDYLDAQQRYRVLETGEPDETGTISVKVLDRQPFQPTVLSALLAVSTTANVDQPTETVMAIAQDSIDPPLPTHPTIDPSSTATSTTLTHPNLELESHPPAIAAHLSGHQLVHAKPYLDLQGFDPAIPAIHDAWVEDHRTVLVLEDRSTWKSLLTSWAEEAAQPRQLLDWMQHMAQLWAVLEPHQACQSLLKIENLRVNAQGELGLQQLEVAATPATAIATPARPSPQLADLGKLWYQLFQTSQRTQIAELIVLCHDLIAGNIMSWDDLRSRLDAIVPAAEMTSDPSSIMTPDKRTPRNPAATSPAAPPQPPPLPVGYPAALDRAPLSGSDLPTLPTFPDFEVDEDETPSEADEAPTAVLPMRLSSMDDAGRTDVGRQRDHNEDCYSIQTEVKKQDNPQERTFQIKGLYILCDGMGGHAGGEVASALAVDSLQQYFASHWQDKLPDEATIKAAILQANQVLFEQNQKNSSSGSGRMGTTLALLLVHDSEVAIAHVGDSRIYRYSRRQGLEQLTIDHEVGQREIQRGIDAETAYGRPDAYQLTQALGPRNENFINPEVKFFELNEDQLLLLCSDGLTDNGLLEFYWESHLDPLLSSRASLEQGVSDLIDLANQHNGHDNITIIAVRAKVQPYLMPRST